MAVSRLRQLDLILTRCVSEGLLLTTQQRFSLTDVSGCENPLKQHAAYAAFAHLVLVQKPFTAQSQAPAMLKSRHLRLGDKLKNQQRTLIETVESLSGASDYKPLLTLSQP